MYRDGREIVTAVVPDIRTQVGQRVLLGFDGRIGDWTKLGKEPQIQLLLDYDEHGKKVFAGAHTPSFEWTLDARRVRTSKHFLSDDGTEGQWKNLVAGAGDDHVFGQKYLFHEPFWNNSCQLKTMRVVLGVCRGIAGAVGALSKLYIRC